MNQVLIVLTNIPQELVPRRLTADIALGMMLFVSFVAVALANFSRPNVYGVVLHANIKLQGLGTFLRETLPIDKLSSFMLTINYFLTSSAIVYLLLRMFPTSTGFEWIVIVFLPVLLLIWTMGSLFITGWITGEGQVVREAILMKLVGAQMSGLIYFLCALIWTLNVQYSNIVLPVVIGFFVAETILRWGKSILSVLRRGVAWYYIILYFCTLEILPFYVVYQLLGKSLV